MNKTLKHLLCLYLFSTGLIFTVKAQDASMTVADSLYGLHDWANAKMNYVKILNDTSRNSGTWAKLGYCNYNLGNYPDALFDYNKSLANNPIPPIRSIVTVRIARTYAMMNKTDETADWVIKATASGYNILPDLDSLQDFKNLRASAKFKDLRQQVYEILYPCAKEPRGHDFDFWIGDWDVFPTGSKLLTGHSHVESISGGCAILENFTSLQLYTGKSFNYYDAGTGKWEQDWVGSGGAADRNRYYNGEYKNRAMHFTYEKVDAKGDKVTGNFIFYNIDKDMVRQYLELSTDGGKTFKVSYDLTYLRKKS